MGVTPLMGSMQGPDKHPGGKTPGSSENLVLWNELFLLNIYPIQHVLNVSIWVKTYFMSQFLNRTFPVFEFYCSQKLNIDLGQPFGISNPMNCSKTIPNTFLSLKKILAILLCFCNWLLLASVTYVTFSSFCKISQKVMETI